MKTEVPINEDNVVEVGERIREGVETRKVKVLLGAYSKKPIGVEVDGVITMFPVAVHNLEEKECCDFCICPVHNKEK